MSILQRYKDEVRRTEELRAQLQEKLNEMLEEPVEVPASHLFSWEWRGMCFYCLNCHESNKLHWRDIRHTKTCRTRELLRLPYGDEETK